MAKIGYARVSSKEQHLDRQLAALKDVDKLFTDKLSGANTNRPELQKMLAYIREGDIVLVTELDRLGRNNQDLTKIMNTIQNKGATLDVLNLPSMTGIADPNLRQLMTNLIIELYKYQAESERQRIIERQQQGIAYKEEHSKWIHYTVVKVQNILLVFNGHLSWNTPLEVISFSPWLKIR